MTTHSIDQTGMSSPSSPQSAGLPAATGQRKDVVRAIAAAVLFLGLTVVLQWRSGAYSAGFAGPDEPAHYVTGLMVHDYLHHWPPASPMRFAEDFYSHYPEVAIGHWPPLFYLMQGLWMSVTSTSRPAVLALMAVLTTLLAFATYRFVRSEYGEAAGLASGVLLICLPLVQLYSAQVMTEVPVALFCLLAALAFGRYLDTGDWRFSAAFGLLASLAILTKGTGFAVLLVVLALVPLRRLRWLARPSFWIAPAIVIALCGLWYRFTMGMVKNGWEEKPSLDFVLRAIPWNAWHLAHVLGLALFPVVLVGIAVKLFRPQPSAGKWAALGMLIAGVWIFQSMVPASLADRHLVTAAAPLVIFLVAGTAWIASRLPIASLDLKTRTVALAAVVAVVFLATAFRVPKFPPGPFQRVVADLLARSELRDAVFLVSSQNYGEGRFIAEMAMREPHPGHIVLRGSKMLAEGDWFGLENNLVYPTTDQAMRFLDDIPVTILVMHQGGGGRVHPDYVQLGELIQQNPSLWEPIGTYKTGDATHGTLDEVTVYQYRNRSGPRVGKIRIDLNRMLGRSIER